MWQISADNHIKEDGSKEELLILKYNLDGKVQKQNQYIFRMELITFVGIYLLSTQMTWLLLTQVQKIRSSFGSEFNFMSGFGTLEMCSYGSWADYLIPVSKSWSLTFWPSHGYKLVQSLTLLRDISLSWCEVCPLLDNTTTWFSTEFLLWRLLICICCWWQ